MDKLLAELGNDDVPEESDKSKKEDKHPDIDLKYDDSIDDETERTDDNTW